MKRNKIKCGLPVTRIGSKHAWYYACVDANNVVRVVMFSYDTPIFIVSNIGKNFDTKLHVILNEDAYNYSRTTSKQISQWISHLHLFTSWGCYLPWDFRHVLDAYERCKTTDTPIWDDVDYCIVSESVLTSNCYALSQANLKSLGLWQVR